MNHVKSEVKVIFLDAGGVLFDETFVKREDRIRSLLTERGYPLQQIDAGIIKAKKMETPFMTNWDEEEAYFTRYYGTIANELGESNLTNEIFSYAHYPSNGILFPEVKDVLAELSNKYRLAIISNALPSMDRLFDRLGIREYFHTIVLSAFVNDSKPREGIYNVALKKAQAKGNESVFIDDKIENIEGAERVGIRGIHLDRQKTNLLELLKEHKLIRCSQIYTKTPTANAGMDKQ